MGSPVLPSSTFRRSRSAERHVRMLLLLGASLSIGCTGKIGALSSPPGSDDGATGAPGIGSKGGQTPGETPLVCNEPTVAATPLRRVTRSEYVNAVRDLLGSDAVSRVPGLADALPTDEKLGNFASNQSTPVSNLDVEQYAEVAETLALSAVTNVNLLVGCDRVKNGDRACVSQFVTAMGLRAHRRPLTTDEQKEYEALYDTYATDGFEDGVRLVLQAMLESPAFLYHVEMGTAPPAAAPVAASSLKPLDPYELASRLSFLFWGAGPDPELLAAARDDHLHTTDELRTAATRLLRDTRAERTLTSFHSEWLGTDVLGARAKDPALFPQFTPDLVGRLEAESTRFVKGVLLDGDGRLETLLTSTYSFADTLVARTYGGERVGLLTQPAFLATHAHPNQTSPVARGKTILNQLLCVKISPPPPDVNTTPPDPAPGLTTRQRFATHEANARCAQCHGRMDPLGFAFEHYDAIGNFHADEGGVPIDATGAITGTRDANGAFDGAPELAERLAGSAQVKDCVAQRWFEYALSRGVADEDQCSFAGAFAAFEKSDYDVRELLLALATSDAFRYRKAP